MIFYGQNHNVKSNTYTFVHVHFKMENNIKSFMLNFSIYKIPKEKHFIWNALYISVIYFIISWNILSYFYFTQDFKLKTLVDFLLFYSSLHRCSNVPNCSKQ